MLIWVDDSFIFCFSLHGQAVFPTIELQGKLMYTPFSPRKTKEMRTFGYTNMFLEAEKNSTPLSLESRHVACEN